MNLDKIRLYYFSFNMYGFSNSLVAVFINLFVLSTSSIMGVVYFNILFYLGITVAVFGCAYLLSVFEPRDLFSYGAVIRAMMLIAILAAAGITSNVPLFGLLYGVSMGMFWLGNNVLTSDITKGADRKAFVYKNNMITSIVSFVAPTIAGVLIEYSQFVGPMKFIYDFAAACVLLIASAGIMRMAKLPHPVKPKKFSIIDSRINSEGYRNYKIYFLAGQMFNVPFILILPLYVFKLTGNYAIAGVYGSYTLLIAIVANYLSNTSDMRWDRLMKVLITGTVASALLFIMPGVINQLVAVFVFAGMYIMASTPLNNQASANFLELIDRDTKDRIHFWINREFYLSSGRFIILLVLAGILFWFGNNIAYLLYVFPVMALYSVIYFSVSARKGSAREANAAGVVHS